MSKVTIENFSTMSLANRKLVLEWRNSDRVRSMMTNQTIIKLEDHLRFIDTLSSRKDKMYFLFSIDGNPFGVLDFANCDWTLKTCETGLYIGNEKFLGLGLLLYYYNFHVAFEHFDFEAIKSEVLKKNSGALLICTRLFGLEIVGETETGYLVKHTKDKWMCIPSAFKQKILSNAQIDETLWV